MSNYTKSTDFAAKDSLATGNSAKVIRGVEHDTEYNNIATAIASKLNTSDLPAGLAFTPVQQGGGTGQGSNKIYIGWSGSTLKAQVDSTDQGSFQFKNTSANFTRTVGAINGQTNYASAGVESYSDSGDVYVSLHAGGASAAALKHVRGGNGIEIRDSGNNLANLAVGQVTSNGVVLGAPFPTGTRMPFAQGAAPTGWIQDTSDAANNRMLRVINSFGGGTGGTSDPILNNVVPAHTHGFTTGTVSADHTHSGSTGTDSAFHTHNYFNASATSTSSTIGVSANANGLTQATGNNNTLHTHSFTTGGISANHTHSGSTDNGSSQTNWTPRYINMIICSKN